MAVRLLRTWAKILNYCWPQLFALYLLGNIIERLLQYGAAWLGLLNHLAGLSSLTLVVLCKLVTILAMFQVISPVLTELHRAHLEAGVLPAQTTFSADKFATTLSMSLLPFFGLYAAWGFLANTLRDYAIMAMALAPAGADARMFEISGGWLLLLPVALAWLVRHLAIRRSKKSTHPLWSALIVVAEANWAFIALYVISTWNTAFLSWLGHLPENLQSLLMSDAKAATALPPLQELENPGALAQLTGLFFYGLYPVVWITLAAVAYGYDISQSQSANVPKWRERIDAFLHKIPRAFREFVGHFITGTIKRYQSLMNGVGLTIQSGLPLVLWSVIIWRSLDAAGAWAWYGLAHLISTMQPGIKDITADIIQLLLGRPSAPGTGLLFMPIKIALVAAVLETGFSQGRLWQKSSRLASAAQIKADG